MLIKLWFSFYLIVQQRYIKIEYSIHEKFNFMEKIQILVQSYRRVKLKACAPL